MAKHPQDEINPFTNMTYHSAASELATIINEARYGGTSNITAQHLLQNPMLFGRLTVSANIRDTAFAFTVEAWHVHRLQLLDFAEKVGPVEQETSPMTKALRTLPDPLADVLISFDPKMGEVVLYPESPKAKDHFRQTYSWLSDPVRLPMFRAVSVLDAAVETGLKTVYHAEKE